VNGQSFTNILENLVEETTTTSLPHFSPELVLCVTIIGLLFLRLFNAEGRLPSYWVALIGTLVAFGCACIQFVHLKQGGAELTEPFFTGLLVFDQLTVFLRLFLLFFLILVIVLTVLSGVPDPEDGSDFYTLLLGSTIGMMLMASANHLLILFLGVEMTSVPSYAMVGFLKDRRLSSEAALKYVVYGAGAAGVMLYGVSLLAGLLGTANMPAIAERLGKLIAHDAVITDPKVMTVMLATLMVLVGLAFKLSIVPFHFWCPDAFEGASAEVAGFLSVASKAAAFALLIRFCLSLVGDDPGTMADIYLSLGVALGVIAAVTCTFGNLAAYAQTNMKRLLAYSTIAHAGYMLMAVAALMVFLNAPAGSDLTKTEAATGCLEALLYYLWVYLFMNLGAFAIVALLRNHIQSEEIDDYAGLAHETPVLCVCMLICLFSLVGLPPFGGFVGKFMIFASLFEAGKTHWSMWAILAIAGLNTVFSLFYYLRVLRAMFLTPRPEGARYVEIPLVSFPAVYVLLISLPVLALGIFVQGLSAAASGVASVLIP